MVVGGVALALAPLPGVPRAFAQAASPDDAFVAQDVPVDVTAANVTDARARGLIQGQVTGFHKVLERLVAREDLARVPALSSDDVINMVRNFSMANERNSAVRYLADMTVRFDPNAIRNFLRGANIPFAETSSKPLVVVPLLRAGDRTLLWEDNNPWRAAWIKVEEDRGLVPLIVAGADAKDAGLLTLEQAATRDGTALQALARAYDAGGILIAQAVTGGAGQPVQVTLMELRSETANQQAAYTQAPEGQSLEDTLAAAARAGSAAIQENWRRRNRISFGAVAQVTALVPIAALKDWLVVRERLAAVPLIQHVDLQAITRDRAQVTLHYAGNPEQLRLAMAQRDLSLAQQSGVWIISRAQRATAQ